MYKFLSFHLSLCSILIGLAECTSSFDQRQTGDLNVQIGLKNIQLIALLKGGDEEYVDYDYAYDYSEMTIKPQNGTTPKPANATIAQSQNNVTTPTPIPGTISQASVTFEDQRLNSTEQNINATELNINTTESSLNATVENTSDMINQAADITEISSPSILSTTKKDAEDGPTTVSSYSTTGIIAAPLVPIKCRRGFVQNNEGKCEYKVHGTTNALRRIVKLAQKIKVGRGYTGT